MPNVDGLLKCFSGLQLSHAIRGTKINMKEGMMAFKCNVVEAHLIKKCDSKQHVSTLLCSLTKNACI